MERECVVGVGSTNPTKVRAVERVFKLICTPKVVPVKVETSVGPQPLGLDCMVLGALERALRALEEVKGAHYGVGVEAGALKLGHVVLDLQAAVVVDSEGRVSVGLSEAFMLPYDWAQEVLKGTPLSTVAAARTRVREIGVRMGVIGYLTGGLITRTDLSLHALIMALTPLLNLELYAKLPTASQLLSALRSSCKRY